MDYEEYFASVHRGSIGFYIYDGDHSYRNQLRGLEVAESFFSLGCVVMVDDTNLDEPRQATIDFLAKRDTKFQILLDQRTQSGGHPTWWNGIILFRRIA